MAFGLMAICLGTIRGQEPAGAARKSDEYRVAYEQGRAEADRELNNQSATIYTYGHGDLFENLDRETGLPYSGFGCVVDDKILGRVDGHNDRIMEHIKAHGLPKGSFKPWEKELFGLKDYFESRRKRDKPEVVTADSPALRSPDGSCTIRPVVKRGENDGKVVKTLAIELSGNGRKPEEIWLLAHADEKVELFWGPEGSRFVVIAISKPRHTIFDLLDLRRPRRLRTEFVSRSEPREAQPKDRPGPR
jgi:hypothetical protein